ncbi:transposable element Tc1 transposase [Trichonephila clavipes]|nr:transposable element Tc1 transposase [Trichonephila clavipes]
MFCDSLSPREAISSSTWPKFVGPNCSNDIIVYYLTYYCLFTTPRSTFQHFTAHDRIVARLRSQWPLRRPHNIDGIVWSGVAANHHDWGQRSQSAFVLQRHTAITPDVTVWGTISNDGRSSLVILQTSLTVQRYVVAILLPVVLFFWARHSETSFQKDNVKPKPLEYLWTGFVPLILFLASKIIKPFTNRVCLRLSTEPYLGTHKNRRSGATTGECLAECIAELH